MRGKGNGDVQVCANNLLRAFRGEVPYERVKGLDPRIIDRPLTTAEDEIQQDALWVLGTYEPRVKANGVSITRDDAASGGFAVVADIEEKEE